MKAPTAVLAGVAAGGAIVAVTIVGFPRASAQEGDVGTAPSPGLGIPSPQGDLAELHDHQHDRRSDPFSFDIVSLIDRDRGLGRLTMLVAADSNDPAQNTRIAAYLVSAKDAMDLQTIAYLHSAERASFYIFEQFDPLDVSIDGIRFYIPFDEDNTTGVVNLDPPVRIRERDTIVAIIRAIDADFSAAEFTLHGTPVHGGEFDSLRVE